MQARRISRELARHSLKTDWKLEREVQKKFAQVRKVHCPHLMLAISERLNLEKAGVKLDNLPAEIVWFPMLSARTVLKALETMDFTKSE
jgi:predicted nuclease of restriction endonuclease-like RecB superfamily